jgi:hypothetical protein
LTSIGMTHSTLTDFVGMVNWMHNWVNCHRQ